MRTVVAEPAGKFWDNGKSPRAKVKGWLEVRAMVVHQCGRRGWSMTTHYSTLTFQGLEHEVCSSGYSHSELRTLAIGPADLVCCFSQFADGMRRFYRAERPNWRQSVWLETALSSVKLSRSICELAEPAGQRTFSRKSQDVFGSEKPVVKLQSACFKKLIF